MSLDNSSAESPTQLRPAGGILLRRRVAILYAAGLGVTLLPFLLLSGNFFWLNIVTYTYLFAGLAVAWNIIAGFGGQFSLGHGVFFATGAYMTARLYLIWGITPWLGLIPPISWMMSGRSRFVSFNFVTTMMLSALLARLPQKRNRVVIRLLIIVLTSMSLLPFLAPAFNRGYLAGLKTHLDADGVCRQSNDYTCKPAAAVTVLRKLGLPAEEGEIAGLSDANSLTGTEPDLLARELQKRYGVDGLVAEYRAFKNVEELRKAGLTVVVLKFNALQDHCVAVLGVETNRIVVGDPLNGLSLVSPEEFESKWLFVGIALKRVAVRSASSPAQAPIKQE